MSTPSPRQLLRIGKQSLGLATLLCLTACGDADPPRGGVTFGQFRHIEDFTLTNQLGETLSNRDLKGRVWIANFIFTSCAAECLILSSQFAQLQMHFRDFADVAFVSLSVDPQTDTPERLRLYSERWHADPGRWHFLTGDPSRIDDLVLNSFLLPVTRDPIAAGKLISESLRHSNSFAIVDRSGKVRAYVDGLSDSTVTSVSQIVLQLLQETSPAAADADTPPPAETPKP